MEWSKPAEPTGDSDLVLKFERWSVFIFESERDEKDRPIYGWEISDGSLFSTHNQKLFKNLDAAKLDVLDTLYGRLDDLRTQIMEEREKVREAIISMLGERKLV
jgi:hypothetical protein